MARNNQETMPTGNDKKPTKRDKWGVIFQGLAAFGALVAVPASVYVAINQNHSQQEQALNQQAQALDQQRQTILDSYLSEIDTLLVNYHLALSRQGSGTVALATARTDTTLRSLDGIHKGILIRYLWETHLINNPNPVIMLYQVDLDEAFFGRANLWLADISQSSLRASDFAGARLYGTDLADDNLSRANLSHADLSGVDLTGANLAGAFLQGAEYNSKPMQMTIAGKSITLPPTQWPKGFDFTSMRAVCVDC